MGELRRHRLRIRLDRELLRRRKRGKEARERRGLGERRRAATEEHRFERRREQSAFELELRQQSLDVRPMLLALPDRRHEVAVAAAMCTEREVHIEVVHAGHGAAARFGRPTSSPPQFGQHVIELVRAGRTERALERADRRGAARRQLRLTPLTRASHLERHYFFVPSRLSTARNASCGTSTAPTCFMRFFPAFCFSRSLRLRVMSPP